MAEDIGAATTVHSGLGASVIADRYEVLGLLGAGGMGRVYRARDTSLDEVIALKMLRKELAAQPGMLERFRDEVKIARRVTHANVVRTFDLGTHGDESFLTMEYIEGRSLAQRLSDGPPAFDETLRILRAVTAGMAAAHASAVLHRDLKPDNILVGKAGRIAVTDFGIARLAQTPSGTAEAFIGTPAYMAPEQVEGRDVTTASDVYAIGAVLFELLTGRRPWLGDDPFAVALARLREPPPDPRSVRAVPDVLAELTLYCLAREPERRPADAGALARTLAAIGDVDMTARQVFVAAVPEKAARTVAILPLRGTGELAEVADGLSEEIVDALSMTKALRVRPLASVRAATKSEADARELGTQLRVDVVVDGSIRNRGPQIRITARAIGVADGFQLWASHFDCGPDGLLAAGDQLVKAIANALVVDLAMPARRSLDAKIAGRYLEAKARLRAAWHDGNVHEAIHILEPLLLEAPDDPRILATTAIALARSAFYAIGPDLLRARLLADKALSVAPDFGEAQLARALIHLYESDVPAAAAMLRRTVTTVPGFSLAQGLLGALLLEAGSIDDAVLHLEAARSIDPTASQLPDLARAYVYLGRHDDAIATLNTGGEIDVLGLTSIARFQMWRGEIRPFESEIPPVLDAPFRDALLAIQEVHRTGHVSEANVTALKRSVECRNPRLRSARAQFSAEYLCFAGRHDDALEMVAVGVDAGLQDALWIERCPPLQSLATFTTFRALAARVSERAQAVITAVFTS